MTNRPKPPKIAQGFTPILGNIAAAVHNRRERKRFEREEKEYQDANLEVGKKLKAKKAAEAKALKKLEAQSKTGTDKAFKDGGLVGNQNKLDKNKDGQISGADFKMMKNGGKVKVKGMAMGGKVKAKGMAMGGKVKAKGMAMGGKVKSKGYALGGSIKSKGAAMGGRGFGAARSSGKGVVTY
tara:strand:+ start:396 stop:941 length:546 start_codon:yes stop_codon:yes gene_type:complete